MSRESSASIAEWIGRHLLTYKRYRPAAEIAALVEAVSAADMKRLAGDLLAKRDTITFTALGPQKGLQSYDKLRELLA
jgi:predicted Zn-dependent peptidase